MSLASSRTYPSRPFLAASIAVFRRGLRVAGRTGGSSRRPMFFAAGAGLSNREKP